MLGADDRHETEPRPPQDAQGDDCPLSIRDQTRNVVLYGAITGLIYLAAPVLYVGILQAALLNRLHTSDALANLPGTMFQGMALVPILVAWAVPYSHLLRPMIVASFAINAVLAAVMLAVMVLPTPDSIKIAAVVIHSAILGITNGVVWTFTWEMLCRGVSAARRGKAFCLAFGFGPMLAVVGSIASHLVLKGEMLGFTVRAIPYPWNFAAVFGSGVPIMALASFLASRYVVPRVSIEVVRKPFVEGVFGGIGEFFACRVVLLAAIGYFLLYFGQSVLGNMSLYTREALGEAPERYAGIQLALRFSFKVVAGFMLGWLLTRTNPRAGVLMTAALSLLGLVWVLLAPGQWFLISFGILGAGELFGVYYPNYIACCSVKAKTRRNMSFVHMVTLPTAIGPVFFGWISDHWGLPASFWTAGAFIAASLLLMLVVPRHPRPPEPEVGAAVPAPAAAQ